MNTFALLVLAPLTFPVGTPPAPADLDQFQGTWRAAAVTNPDGRPAPPDELAVTTLVVAGDRFTLAGKDFKITGRFTLDPARTPKAIDVVLDTKEGDSPVKLLGIYQITGDTRRSCFAMPDQERPKGFPAAPKGFLQFEWKRPTK